MRAVEDAALGVAPATGQEPEAHRPVRDVRRRQHEPAVVAEQRTDASQEPLGRAQVLDQVAAQDDVERAFGKGELHRLHVADQHLGADLSRGLGRLLVQLDPHHRAAALDQGPRQIPARAADVEHALSRADEREQLRVPAVRPLVQGDVTRLG